MKVALLASYLPPFNDGVGDHADRLARALAAGGNDVLAISVGTAAMPAAYRLALVGTTWNLSATARAIAALREHGSEAVIVEYTPFLYGAASPAPLAVLLAARLLRKPSAIVVHEAFYAAGSAAVRNAAKALAFATRDALTISAAGAVAVPSTARAQALGSRLPFARGRIVVVPIGANVEPPPDYRRLPATPKRIVSFGVVMPRRRLEYAVRAVARLRDSGADVHLEVIGRTHDRAYAATIADLAVQQGVADRVTFRGELLPAEISAAFSGAAAAVHAPLEGSIPSSGSLLALLAHGVPVVALRTAHDDRVFEGALRFADDEAALAGALRALALDAGAGNELSAAAGRVYAANFTWETAAGLLLRALTPPAG